MKKNFISLTAAAALLLATAAVVPASATEVESASTEIGTFMPTPKKKTTKKSSTTKKKSTKSSSKKSTTTSKKTTKASTKTTEAEPTTSTESTESNSSTGSVLGGILGGILGGGSSSSSSNNGGLMSALSTIFDNSKVATADKIIGTWKYTEPAVVFESNNALKNIGGKVASAAIEKKLESQLEKLGIKKGKLKMTFDKSGNFTQTLGAKTLNGTYTIDGKQVVLTYTGGIKQLIGTTQVDGNSLLIVMDVSKLMKYAGTLGKLTGNSSISTLSSLLGSYDGMEVGVKLEK